MLVKCLKLKKGFTLVELMGVIVILGVIALIAIPTIDKQLKEGKRDLSQAQLDNIKSAAELWVADNPNDMPQNGEECYLKYSTLVDSGYAEENLKEISSNTDIVDNKLKIKISKDDTYNKYNYIVEFNNNGYTLSDTDKYCNGYIVTFDANGGNLSTDSKKVFYHSTYGELPTPTKEGYTFLGWNGKNKVENGDSFDNFSGTGTRDTSNTLDGSISIKTNQAWQGPHINLKQMYESGIIKIGDKVTFSTYFKINFVFTKNTSFTLYRASANSVSYQINKNDITQNEWYRINFTTTIDQTSIEKTNTRIETNYYENSDYTFNGNLWFARPQVEINSTVTEYEPYYITSSTKVVQPNNHTLTAIWQANS